MKWRKPSFNKNLLFTKQANALFDAVFDCQSKPAVYPYYHDLSIRSDVSQLDMEQDYLAKGMHIYHCNHFTTQKQSDPFIGLSLSSESLRC